jgi:hypothetical protein
MPGRMLEQPLLFDDRQVASSARVAPARSSLPTPTLQGSIDLSWLAMTKAMVKCFALFSSVWAGG